MNLPTDERRPKSPTSGQSKHKVAYGWTNEQSRLQVGGLNTNLPTGGWSKHIVILLYRAAHGSGRVGFGPKLNSTWLDRVTEFRTRIQSNIQVGSDFLGNRLSESKLSV